MDSSFSFQQVTNPYMSWYRMRNDIISFRYDFSLITVRKKNKNVYLMQNPYQDPTVSKHSWSISQYPRGATRPLLYFSSRNVGDPGWVRWRQCSVAGLPGSHRYGFPSGCSAFNSDPIPTLPWHICHLSSVEVGIPTCQWRINRLREDKLWSKQCS